MRFITAFFMSTALALAACVSTNPATGAKQFSLVSEQQEFELGHELVKDEVDVYGLYKEKPELTAYYKELGQKLVAVTERSDKPFDFLMIDSDALNAWAIPGYVNVYRGIMPMFNSEAELVAVMAHEAGHITARHTARHMTTGTIANISLIAGAALLASLTDSDELLTAAQIGGGVGVALALRGYGRAHETEADELALRYMGRLGYDPRESYHVYKTFARYRAFNDKTYAYFHDGKTPPKPTFYSLMLSHPEPEKRAQHVAELTGGLPDGSVKLPQGVFPATPFDDPQGQNRYFSKINGIAFGTRVEEGVAARGMFYAPKQQFMLPLPRGIILQHLPVDPKAAPKLQLPWVGYDQRNDAYFFMGHKSFPKAKDAEEVLRIVYPKLRDITPVVVNGRTAYSGMGDGGMIRADLKGKKLRVVVIPGVENGDSREFVFAYYAAPFEKFNVLNARFESTLAGAKILTRTQVDSIEPLRVSIYTIKPGDTITSLAHAMQTDGFHAEWFKLLNGLDDSSVLHVGQKVKIVANPNLSKRF